MIVFLAALPTQAALPPIEDSLALYRAWDAKLAKASSITIDVLPSGNGEGHDVWYSFRRPRFGAVHGWNYGLDSDGRRTRSDCGMFGKFDRPARADDLKTYLALPGFESFYAPKAKVEGGGPLRVVAIRGSEGASRNRLVAADLRIDGMPLTLYFDPIARTPVGYGRFRDPDPYEWTLPCLYLSFHLDPKGKPFPAY